MSYIAVTVLYAVAGAAAPHDAAARLAQIAQHTGVWWAILSLSVATDLLFLPVMWSLYTLLKHAGRNATLAGTGLVGLFVILDLALTWPNYATLITLADSYPAITDNTQRTVVLGAATYATDVLSSGLFGVYTILVPAAGVLIIGLVMLKASFGRTTAWLGIATGVSGFIAVAGPLVIDIADAAAIVTSILTLLWVLLVGYKLLTPSTAPAAT